MKVCVIQPHYSLDEKDVGSCFDGLMAYAPDLRVCVGWEGNKNPMSMADRAIALGAYKVQLFKPYFSEETIKKAHAHGICATSSGRMTLRRRNAI